jgi:hypothetical protein
MRECLRTALLAAALALVCMPTTAFAQVGSIAGTVRDSTGAVLPGATVEVTSPQLIERTRSTVTDSNGRYQIVSLPVGIYKVTFTLSGFATLESANIELTSDVTAPVNAEMTVGARSEVVTVTAAAAVIDVQNARQRQVFTGDEVADLPTTRNLGDLVQLVPGIAIAAAGGNSEPTICSGGQGQGGFSGALSGCSPIFEGFNTHSSLNDAASINQGRMQVDGLGVQSFGGGGRSSYIADVGNSQEISLNLSGALGESETGGATINVVPRTGGNRYAGNYFTAYSSGRFYGKNDGTHTSTFSNRLIREYDVNGAYGGPILRDRLWFYSAARRQDRENMLTGNYRNLNAGVFGANYQYDPASPLNQGDRYQNANTRITWQAAGRNKFNIFWDEQYTCENPCRGGGAGVSVEATASLITRPLHLAQLSWTNPLTNRILLDAGVSHYGSHRNESRHLFETNYPNIPRIAETGSTTGVVPGAFTTAITSGSINNAINWKNDNWQSRASASYVTGSHNLKIGYQGQYLARVSQPYYNDLRLQYAYATPAANCVATAPEFGAVTNQTWCGLFPDGVTRIFDGRHVSAPLGPALPTAARPPVPTTVTQYIPAGSDEAAWFAAFYVQDQWTVNRFTLSGALRYDHAQSRFDETCVGPDLFKANSYCLNDPSSPVWGGGDGKGVSYHDITPRLGVAWDLFGTGTTSIKWSMGKYLEGSQAGGIYTASNPASGGRTVNSYSRVWRDLDGDRIVDCDLRVPAVAPPAGQALPANGECGSPAGGGSAAALAANSRRFGRSPNDLDELGLALGLNTIYCDPDEIAHRSVSALVRNYCNNYFAAGGSSLLQGWGRRQFEWQQSIGVQHQLLPRLSGELTWNWRKQYNQRVTDALGSGCDLYSSQESGTVDAVQCMDDLFAYRSSTYDFYGVRAPADSRLPGGGAYLVEGIATAKPNVSTAGSGVSAVTVLPDGFRNDFWSGIDTNFVYRGPRGLRVSGGTSTGRRNDNQCRMLIDDPPAGVRLNEGRERACENTRIFQTNVRGTASYTIPWVDVLVSSTFSVRPGVEYSANYTVDVLQGLEWGPFSQNRIGTALVGNTSGTVTQDLLGNDTYGERITLVDMKFAKNIRFMGKRINVGVDVYNVLNSDAARAYCSTFPNPAQGVEGCSGSAAAGNLVEWGSVTNIVTPRYARFQIRADF